MKQIPVYGGYVALVDDEDFEWRSRYKWQLLHNGYAARKKSINGRKTNIRMHREILNPPDGMLTDHINGNRLDNRRSNLRLATHSQNCRNKKKMTNNTTGYKGVVLQKGRTRFRATIYSNGKNIWLGHFDTAEEAHAAYCAAAKELFGEFARFE